MFYRSSRAETNGEIAKERRKLPEAMKRWQPCVMAFSGRSRQLPETEIPPQRPHQFPILRRRPLQAETGVVMVRRFVFVAPQAAGLQVDKPRAIVSRRDFQPQFERGADHQWQVADQHQPVFRNIAQETDRFVGNAVEHF